MAGGSLLLVPLGALAALALLLCLWLLRVVERLQRRVQRLEQSIAGQQVSDRQPSSFSASLGLAERRAETARGSMRSMSQGERYGYIAALAEQGLDAAGIAAALQMSLPEVEQLLKLARLRPQGQNPA